MLLRLAAEDKRKLGLGIAALLLIIIAGVAVVENQLNDLTRYQDFEQVLNIRRDSKTGTCTLYVLGGRYSVKSLYSVAGIGNTDKALFLNIAGRELMLSTVLYFDLAGINYWLTLWYRQFIVEAVQIKKYLQEYAVWFKPLFQQFINFFKH